MVNLNLWNDICNTYKKDIGDELYTFLFSNATPIILDEEKIVVEIDKFSKNFFNTNSDNYKTFAEAVQKLTYNNNFILEFITKEDKVKVEQTLFEYDEPLKDIYDYKDTNLKSNFTFKNFFYSYENKPVINATKLVIDSLNNLEANPLFIYGSSGLGKTHILNAIGNEIIHTYKDKKVLYLQSTDFLEEYTSLFKGALNNTNKIEEFKQKYLSLDVLLIDDIQLLESKEGSLNEFFTIFEKMRNNNKLIVIASDKHPQKIHFEARLITRFLSGLSCEVMIPDTDTKKQIFSYYALKRDINIDEEAISVFIEHSNNIRALLGFINNVTVSLISNEIESNIITKQDAIKILNKISIHPHQISEDDIIKIICDYYKVSKKEVLSEKRTKEIVNARHFIAYFLKEKLDYKHIKIAYTLGFKDHTASINAIKSAKKKSNEKKYINEFQNLTQLLNT